VRTGLVRQLLPPTTWLRNRTGWTRCSTHSPTALGAACWAGSPTAELTVGELAAPLTMSLAAASKWLSIRRRDDHLDRYERERLTEADRPPGRNRTGATAAGVTSMAAVTEPAWKRRAERT